MFYSSGITRGIISKGLIINLCEIENKIKVLSTRLKPLIRGDAEYRNEVVSQTQYSLTIKKLKQRRHRSS